MSTLSRNFKRNKPLWIFITAIISIIAIVAIGIGGYILSPAGKASYQAVEVPSLSKELTDIPEAPVGRLDAPDDEHIGVDMLGQTVATVDTDTSVDSNEEQPAPGAESPVGNTDDSTSSRIYSNIRERTQAMNQVSNLGERFKIDSVGLDVPLGAITMVDDAVEPTNFTSVFQIRNLGVPYTNPAEGTTYLATHALDVEPDGNMFNYTPGGIAPGNFFFDSTTGESTLNEGDEIVVGDRTFAVTGSERIGKGMISQNKELWDSSIQNRLVILLCQPDSNDNHVVYASPVL